MTDRQKEAEFEKGLIEALCSGQVGVTENGAYRSKLWTYMPNIKTTEQLWQNFANILYKNNQDKLDHPLSYNEFDQVKRIINGLTTPYQAGQFLYGYHGVSQVEIDLDDGRHVFLTVFDQDQIGAGNTVYQVVNQIIRPAKIPGKKDRRFDVTLLINGLPLIQIELKAEDVDVNDALNQMHNYIDENQYSDIFSLVQILVAMTPYDAKYMANTTSGRFNKDFAFHWQRKADNSNVLKWREFAEFFLSIPAAHRMSTTYMILDGTRNQEGLKVMRPYQVYATEAVLDAIKKTAPGEMGVEKLGYIWHTTGSGKTITSFKTAWLASRLPGVDKVVFLVDRKQLTRQTFEKYRAYDPEYVNDDDIGRISDTHNTSELARRLSSENSDIIVTSVQKLQKLTLRRKTFKAPEKNFIFIVDEAHRSTSSDKFEQMQKAFPHSGWIGYTGTPTFDTEDGGKPTRDVFGECLHEYTIREAIADHNVLGFKVDFEDTRQNIINNSSSTELTKQLVDQAMEGITPDELKDENKASFYDNNPGHVKAVVENIFQNWKNRSNDGKYNALLTTHVGGQKSSVPMAMMYYDEFQRVNAEHAKTGDLVLKVAVTFSYDNSDSDEMMDNNSAIERAMRDYSKMFGTEYNADNFAGYSADVISRLDKSADDGRFLDIVIVINQLLTGFDAPGLNTLYVDRSLHGAQLIQAYSRTNRVQNNQDKPWGQIVNFRFPKQNEKNMNEALAKYSNKTNATLLTKETLIDNHILAEPFNNVLDETKMSAAKLRVITENFNHIPADTDDQMVMLDELRKYNANLAKLKQYPYKENEDGTTEGYDYEHPEELIAKIGLSEDESKILSTTLTNELKRAVGKKENVPPSNVELTVVHLKEVHVDYKYLTELLKKLMNQIHDDQMKEAEKTRDMILEFADTLENPEYAKAIREAAAAIFNKQYPELGSSQEYPVKEIEVNKVIHQAQQVSIQKKILDFRNKWGITDVISGADFLKLIANHNYGEKDLDEAGTINEILFDGSQVYQTMSDSDEVKSLKKLKYRNSLRQAIYDFADKFVEE